MTPLMSRRTPRRLVLATGLLAGLALTACGGGAAPAMPTAEAVKATPAVATVVATSAAPAVAIADAWARATPGLPDENSAVYAILQNRGTVKERVVSASAPETIAKRVELHTTVQENGVMKMMPVEGFDIPASGSLKLEPGANHIMLLGIAKQFKAGDTFTISLKLQSGAVIESKVEVKNAPGAMPGSGPAGIGPGGAAPGGMGPGGAGGSGMGLGSGRP